MSKPSGQTAFSVFPVSNYKFGTKAPKPERDSNAQERLNRIKNKCVQATACVYSNNRDVAKQALGQQQPVDVTD